MRSNPYVYPFIPFIDLLDKRIRNNFKIKSRASIKKLYRIIGNLTQPEPKIFGKSIAEKILSIFIDKNFIFGPRKFIDDNKKFWIRKFNYFINKNKPLQFTILGFPFKIPVPLKTNRTLPDMGEVLSLSRLNLIAMLIKKIYKSGAKITIFSEGAFAESIGITREKAVSYHNFLVKLNKLFNFKKNLKITPLSLMEKKFKNFNEAYKKNIVYFKTLFNKRDPYFLKKYKGAYKSIYRIVSPGESDECILMDIYNTKIKNQFLSEQARKARQRIKTTAHEAIFKYFAYLALRDKINYIEKKVPHAITLTVSPKPNRLGIIPVHKECIRLPYHAVPVYYPKENKFLLEYLIDIKRSRHQYKLVYFDQDKENKPFYYSVIK